MKKLSILFFTIMVSCSVGFGQDTVVIDSIPVRDTSSIDSLPDFLCLPFQDTTLCLPTGDGKEAFDIVKAFFERNKGNWPKTAMGWIGLIVAFLISVPGVTLITRSKSIYKFLIVFLGQTLNIVFVVAGVITALLTYLWGLLSGGGWHWTMFLAIWPFMAFGAVWAYEKWFKKKDVAARLAAKK